MGVHILRGDRHAVMYCSTTDWAFGPVFNDSDTHDADERIESFLRFAKIDPRGQSDAWLESKYSEWLSQEEVQWKAERLIEELEND